MFPSSLGLRLRFALFGLALVASARAAIILDLDLTALLGITDTITVANSDHLTITRGLKNSSLTNNGVISLNSTGNLSDLILSGGTITFLGTGSITMSNNVNNRIYGATTSDGFLNSAGHTIQGAGRIGLGITSLNNQGLIVANQSAGLFIDPDSTGMTNTGILRATSGAVLTLENGPFNSTGGSIEAQDTSRVDLSNATISGGTLVSSGTGKIQALNQSTLSGVTVNPNTLVELPNGQRLNLTGNISNSGTLSLLGGTSSTDLVIKSAGATLTGGGAITLSNSNNNRLYGESGTTTLVNQNNTISGAGQIGLNQLILDNRGTINANTSGSTLQVDLAGTSTNTGTMQASNGGTLEFSGTTLTNDKGTVRATNGSRVLVDNSSAINKGNVAVDAGGILELVSSTLNATLTNASGGIVKLTGGTSTLTGVLTNLAGGEVQLANNATLQLVGAGLFDAGGTYSNSGVISMNSSGNLSDLIITGGNVTLSGTGTLTLSNQFNNRIYGTNTADQGIKSRLINGVGHTIQGSGQIGVGLMGFTNQGLIVANQPVTLKLSPSSTGAVNTGTLRATNTATLEMTGNYTNSGGTVEALADSAVRFDNAFVFGGTLTSVGTGRLVNAANSTLLNVTISAGSVFEINNGTQLRAELDINNFGTINLNSSGSSTDLILDVDPRLYGSGTISLSNNLNNRIYGADANIVLTNFDNTIQGAGQIGVNQLIIDNRGLINANFAGSTLVIDPTAGGSKNSGTLQASNGGILKLQGGAFDNTGGTVRALAGSMVQLDNAKISGGTFDVAAAGLLSLASSTIDGGTLSTAPTGSITIASGTNTLSGNITVNAGAQLTVANNATLQLLIGGTFTHNGTLTLASSGNLSDLVIGGDVTFAGTGSIVLGSNNNNRIYGSDLASGRLFLTSSITLQGGGQVGVGSLKISNAGIIEANDPTTALILDPVTVALDQNGLTNTGTLRATNGATLRITSGRYGNAGGTIEAQTGSQVTFENVAITGGNLSTAGTGRLVHAANSSFTDVNLASGAIFDINNNTAASFFGSLTNGGTINLNSVGNLTDLIIGSSNFQLLGNGVISMGNNFNNRIYGPSALPTSTLINQSGLIHGAGQLGLNLLVLDNRGTIQADINGSTLEIDVTADGSKNIGTLRAINGGNLRILNSGIDNTGGTILADAGSRVTLAVATITGGTLQTGSGGAIQTVSANNIFTGTINIMGGTEIDILNNTNLTLKGMGSLYTNNGTIVLSSAGNLTDLLVNGGDVVVTGGGNITLGNNSNNRILGYGSSDRLVNSSGHLIQGAGQIGVGLMGLLNQGMVVANQPTSLIIQPSALGVTNTGRLRAEAGSTLRLQSGTFTNTNGVIEAVGTGAAVEFNSANIVDGTLITGTGAALRSIANSSFSNVTLSPGSTMEIINNSGAKFGGTFTNNGTLSLLSGGNFTDFIVDGNLILEGNGIVKLGNNSNNRIYGAKSTDVLTNRSTIAGSGQIFFLKMFNEGTILANQSTPLTLASTPGVVNTGVLRAESGGTLDLGGTVLNSGGTIEALGASSTVIFDLANVSNGTLQAGSGGVLKIGGPSVFNSVTLSGGATLLIPNAASATFNGTFSGNGTVQLRSGGNFTDFLVGSSGLKLASGVVELGNNSNNRLYSPSGTTTLVNQGATIRGAGQIGLGITGIENNSTIEANIAGATLVFTPTASAINTGLLSASNGGTLRIKSGTVTNTGGFITAGTGSVVELDSGTTIVGGTVGSGTIRSVSSATLQGLTIAGSTTVEIPNATSLTLSGAIANSGTIQLQSGGNFTDLFIAPTGVTLTGHGIIELGNNSNNRVLAPSNSATLNNVDNVIRGSGQLGNNLLSVNNSGTIQANQSTPLTVSGMSTNQGVLQATNGGQMIVTGNLTNRGTVTVDTGGTFTAQGAYSQPNGSTLINGGTFSATSASFDFNTVLAGTGTVNGPVTVSGFLSAGVSGSRSTIGQLTFNQSLTLIGSSFLLMEIGGVNDYDRIQAPNVALGGSLWLSLTNGFQSTIQPSDTFTLLSTTNLNGLSGTFLGATDGSRVSTFDRTGSFQINYSSNGVTLSNFAVTVPEPSTYVLLAVGLGTMWGLQRRRRRRQG